MRHTTNLKSAASADPSVGQRIYEGSLGHSTPDRQYQIRLGRRSHLHLSLSGLQTEAKLTLLDQNGKTLKRSTHQQSQRESLVKTVKPGTYYVRVSRQHGQTQYQLTVQQQAVQKSLVTPQQRNAATQKHKTDLQRRPNLASQQRKALYSNPLINQVLGLVNQYRNQAGLRPIRLNARLNASAQAHSQDMAINDFFGHNGSNGSTADDRILAAGYNYALVGENIAAGFATAQSVVKGWMESPSHRKNILHPFLRDMGVGFHLQENDLGSTNYRYYWTQDFGKPMN